MNKAISEVTKLNESGDYIGACFLLQTSIEDLSSDAELKQCLQKLREEMKSRLVDWIRDESFSTEDFYEFVRLFITRNIGISPQNLLEVFRHGNLEYRILANEIKLFEDLSSMYCEYHYFYKVHRLSLQTLLITK